MRRRALWRRTGVLARPSADIGDDGSQQAPSWPALRALRCRWAELLRRVFEVDPRACPRCGALVLHGLLNAGHARPGAVVIRAVGVDLESRSFSTWCAKAVALIGGLPDSVEHRAVIVPMRRRSREERVGRLRIDPLSDLEPLRRRATRWAAAAPGRSR